MKEVYRIRVFIKQLTDGKWMVTGEVEFAKRMYHGVSASFAEVSDTSNKQDCVTALSKVLDSTQLAVMKEEGAQSATTEPQGSQSGECAAGGNNL